MPLSSVAWSNTRKYNPKYVLNGLQKIWPGFPRPETGGSTVLREGQSKRPETPPVESLPDIPLLDPSVMKFTYPPISSDGEELRDMKLFDKMLDELEREQAYMKEQVEERNASVAAMFRQFGLTKAEVDEEVDEWQDFLNRISSSGGSKMTALLERVDEEVSKGF